MAAAVLAALFFAPDLFREKPPPPAVNAFKIYKDTAINSMLMDAPMTAVMQEPRDTASAEPSAAKADTPSGLPTPAEPADTQVSSPPEAQGPFVTERPADPAPAQLSPPPSQPPTSLGKLIVKPGDTLVGMIYRVYGSHHPKHLRAVIEANVYLENPNRIDIGNVIQFPPFAVTLRQHPQPVYWVLLEEQRTLPSAMQRVDEITRSIRIPLQLLPSWSSETGLKFQLLVKGYFSDIQEANNYIQALPENLSDNGRVLSEWPEETRFFSDPYSNGAH